MQRERQQSTHRRGEDDVGKDCEDGGVGARCQGLESREETSMPPTQVIVDNSGVISMMKDNTLKSANNHMFRTLQECRERVNLDKAVITVEFDTKDKIVNAMTKQEPGLDGRASQLRLITGPCSVSFSCK